MKFSFKFVYLFCLNFGVLFCMEREEPARAQVFPVIQLSVIATKKQRFQNMIVFLEDKMCSGMTLFNTRDNIKFYHSIDRREYFVELQKEQKEDWLLFPLEFLAGTQKDKRFKIHYCNVTDASQEFVTETVKLAVSQQAQSSGENSVEQELEQLFPKQQFSDKVSIIFNINNPSQLPMFFEHASFKDQKDELTKVNDLFIKFYNGWLHRPGLKKEFRNFVNQVVSYSIRLDDDLADGIDKKTYFQNYKDRLAEDFHIGPRQLPSSLLRHFKRPIRKMAVMILDYFIKISNMILLCMIVLRQKLKPIKFVLPSFGNQFPNDNPPDQLKDSSTSPLPSSDPNKLD